ncbi:Topoisomerase VI [Spironucleus salmonicida]|uniref:Topoisomerase VI n=1 Tax=Spironucleus salmonicida TaxID=348837 RepID=V6LB25_9EUKA|nr:Topoisomerase VI [Spironucleus salmonicida]|eukprot:EST41433.1 Type IIB DNA topoisomerase domain-containing protein [Spironucleus salmonicida]
MQILDQLLLEMYSLVQNPFPLHKQIIITRKLHILTISIILITNNDTMNIRALYYQFPDIFPTQVISNSILRQLQIQLNIQKRFLNFTTSAKGLFMYKNKVELIQEFSVPADKITIIIEKDTIFSKLGALSNKYLLVTGKGFPDQLTLNFIAKIPQKSFGFCDFNASGHDIMRIYCQHARDFSCLGLFSSLNDTGQLESEAKITGVQKRLLGLHQQIWAGKLNTLREQRKGELDDFVREYGENTVSEFIASAIREVI